MALLSLSFPARDMQEAVFAALTGLMRGRKGAKQTARARPSVGVRFSSARLFVWLNELKPTLDSDFLCLL